MTATLLPFLVLSPELLPAAIACAPMQVAAPILLSERKAGLEALVGEHALVMIYDAQGLALQPIEKPLPGPVRVDFVQGALSWRTAQSQGRGEMVAKACGVKKGARPTILDATAGLGRDAWILASAGCRVQMCERSTLVAALLQDGLRRAQSSPEVADTVSRLSFLARDAQQVLIELLASAQGERPEVVYLDPMFPHRDKSALVKIDMRVFRQLVGEDEDADMLLALARQVATKRVVVKRARHAPDLGGLAPQQRLLGQSSRFDLYTPV